MEERNAIGVVGGLGPYAGLDLVKKVFDETEAASDQEHLPVALVSFPGHIPDRSTYIADQTAPDPVPPLAEVLRRLDAAGCAVAGMPCNTAHAPVIFDALTAAMAEEGRRIRLLNMIEASAASVRYRAPEARRVGVLATTSTLQNQLYDRALEALGLETVRPEPDFQHDVVNPVIFDGTWGIKAQSNPPTERARRVPPRRDPPPPPARRRGRDPRVHRAPAGGAGASLRGGPPHRLDAEPGPRAHPGYVPREAPPRYRLK
jgi:aspartate racemase